MLVGVDDGLGTIAQAEFSQQPTHVRLDGLLGDEQLACDLCVRLSLSHQFEHFTLTWSQRCEFR